MRFIIKEKKTNFTQTLNRRGKIETKFVNAA